MFVDHRPGENVGDDNDGGDDDNGGGDDDNGDDEIYVCGEF